MTQPAHLPATLRETLAQVATVMVEAREPWWIISSAAAALHGATPIEAADVDVLLSVADAQAILPGLDLVPQSGNGSARFRSTVFATWRSPPLPVDFMADFYFRTGEVWCPVAPQSRLALELDGKRLFVPSRTELHALFLRFDRPKDRARAQLLEGLPTDCTAPTQPGYAR